ncbi:MAG TPA: hypothetical protein VF212_00715 [Longimicrobiales bacterium]
MRALWIVGSALAFSASALWAQDDVYGPALLDLPASTRALALGGAYVTAHADPDALFYNPALLVAARGVGLAYQRWGEASDLGQVSAAMELAPGGLGVGLRFLNHEVPVEVPGSLRLAESELFRRGGEPSSSLEAVLGYAREVGPVRVGVAGKYIQEQVGGGRDADVTLDVGAAMRVGPVMVGLAARNVAGDLEPVPTRRSVFPRQIALHASHPREAVGPLDVVTTAAVSVVEGGEVVPAAGLELAYWPVGGKTFVGRLGVRRPVDGLGPVTAGGAFVGDRFAVEYAYARFEDGSGTHRIGVRWRER